MGMLETGSPLPYDNPEEGFDFTPVTDMGITQDGDAYISFDLDGDGFLQGKTIYESDGTVELEDMYFGIVGITGTATIEGGNLLLENISYDEDYEIVINSDLGFDFLDDSDDRIEMNKFDSDDDIINFDDESFDTNFFDLIKFSRMEATLGSSAISNLSWEGYDQLMSQDYSTIEVPNGSFEGDISPYGFDVAVEDNSDYSIVEMIENLEFDEDKFSLYIYMIEDLEYENTTGDLGMSSEKIESLDDGILSLIFSDKDPFPANGWPAKWPIKNLR